MAYATVVPSVNFRHLEEVLIITEETSAEELAEIQQQKQEEEAAEQAAQQENADGQTEEPAEGTNGTEGGG